jgi:hypothetical protein
MNDGWKDQSGALIGTRDGDPKTVTKAIERAMRDLGYRATNVDAGLTTQHFQGERGAWIVLRVDRGTARGLAARLAANVTETVFVLAARATYRENVQPPCLFDASEATVTPDGRFDLARPSALEGITFGERDLETDHPWRLVEVTLDAGIGLWMGPHRELQRIGWVVPPALGNARLDALARQIRAGARVERVVITGRRALRVKAIDGTVSTAFLSDDEVATLAEACPGALPD